MTSKTQIDRLGDRLRDGDATADDVRLLNEYRGSFAEAYEAVVATIRNETGLEPSGRPTKSTESIADKLRRESIRLSQVQDIAGCRLIVTDTISQDQLVARLAELLDRAVVVDRRQKPSHGYRAVHIVATIGGKTVEVQVRTVLQHKWSQLSEQLSDSIDPALKYGGGDNDFRFALDTSSELIMWFEAKERAPAAVRLAAVATEIGGVAIAGNVDTIRKEFETKLEALTRKMADLAGGDHAVPD